MALIVRRRPDESWRAAVARIGAAQGLEAEVLAEFDDYLGPGRTPALAAYVALSEWDCLEYVEDA